MKNILFILLAIGLFNCSQPTENENKEEVKQTEETIKLDENIYSFNYESPTGEVKSMKEYKGRVILIVNTATQCGLTPQFEGLEKLNKTYKSKGLKVLGFPCNQFGGQEPLSNEDMVESCKINHGVTFELTKKIEVNGEKQNAIYEFLKSQQPLADKNDIRWNFEKFLINKEGQVIKRFDPRTKPSEITAEIENLL